VNLDTAGTIATSLGIATGNTLEAVIGAWLVNRFANGRNAFARPGDVFRFGACVGLGATTVSATIGVTTLALGGFALWDNYASIWFTWWLGKVVGALIIPPLLLVWSNDRHIRWTRANVVETASLLTILALACWVVFGDAQHRLYPFMAIPALVWIAF